ncbi:hypothetical protein HDU96_007044 [Phlyctochytrium bullatum]|nr:hypothetical protein HDU96_007044 [Phlyctochytrium bullatum]
MTAAADIKLSSPPSSSSPLSLEVTIRPHGATISHLVVIDNRTGKRRDVVQGFDSLEEQKKVDAAQHPYYGTIGRVCNRIKEGTFTLNNRTYNLPINNGPNSLHGGLSGFDQKHWIPLTVTPHRVELEHLSPAGDESYPLSLRTRIIYEIPAADPPRLVVSYSAAVADDAEGGVDGETETVVNLTTHSYFNLTGLESPTVLDHTLQVHADPAAAPPRALATGGAAAVPGDAKAVPPHLELTANQVPTWKVERERASLNFGTPKPLGKDLAECMEFRGYDHFFLCKDPAKSRSVFAKSDGWDEVERQTTPVATLESRDAGLKMVMKSSAVGFQLYTANWLDGSLKAKESTQKGGHPYGQYSGVCLEASAPPDAINCPDASVRGHVVIGKDQVWKQRTALEFSAI